MPKLSRKKLIIPEPSAAAAQEWLQCVSCGLRFGVAPLFFGCPKCFADGTLSELEMRYRRPLAMAANRDEGIWGWRSHLPSIPQESRITLGEGSTSLLPIHETDSGPMVYMKNETTNPTWSWKDRANAISVSMARHFGFEHVISVSTGNHGNAMAAMATAGGLKATVFCNVKAPPMQLALMQAYGARVVRGGNSEAMVLDAIRRGDCFPCTTFSLREAYSNPFGIEGFKTIAFEIFQQLGQVPSRVFVGVGSGDGIYGIWKGFRELRECGLTGTTPRIIGCQTIGANSLVRAYKKRTGTITRLRSLKTVASSLAELTSGRHALRAVYDSGGEALEVTDKAALNAMHWMARRGIALEASSAVPLACLLKARKLEGDKKNRSEKWVFIGSGAAPKWPEDVLRGFTLPRALDENQAVLH